MFGGFNAPFASDDTTGFEWLSRNEAEVAKYVADRWCGFGLSNGYVADILNSTAAMWTDEAEASIPHVIPVYVFRCDLNPVGGENVQAVRDLVERNQALGVESVTLKLYPGARHETLNKTNRDENRPPPGSGARRPAPAKDRHPPRQRG